MKYNVLEDFSLNVGKADPVEVKAGSVFVPAATNVPLHKVNALLNAGTIELIRPVSTATSSKKK
jgi:hypothetical protein